jgi:hypothetical protein
MSKKSKQKAAKAAAKQAVVMGATAPKAEVFEGDSKILPALEEQFKEDKQQVSAVPNPETMTRAEAEKWCIEHGVTDEKSAVTALMKAVYKKAHQVLDPKFEASAQKAAESFKKEGTPLSSPVALKQSPLVKTQAEPTVKPLPVTAMQEALAKQGITGSKEGLAVTVSGDNKKNQAIKDLVKALPDETPITVKTPAEKAAEGAAYHTTPVTQSKPVAETKAAQQGIAVGRKVMTAARQMLEHLWESAKVFGALKPDPADTYKMSFKDTKVLEASINHLEKYLVGMADNLSPEAWKHFNAHTKIQHNHMLCQIERGKAYIKEHGTLTM